MSCNKKSMLLKFRQSDNQDIILGYVWFCYHYCDTVGWIHGLEKKDNLEDDVVPLLKIIGNSSVRIL